MSDLIYAVGDIHGDLQKLQDMHARILRDAGPRDHTVVHIGDLVDRRHDSRGVIALLMQGQAAGKPWVVLKGNHDRMMTDFIRQGRRDHRLRPDWTWLYPQLGAARTLASYGIDITTMTEPQALAAARAAVPEAHLDYLESLPDRWETGDVFFCHAGILPGRPLDEQVEDDLIWIRKPFHDHTGPHPKLIVHGHTPIAAVTHYGNRVNIDTGCAYGHALSAIVLEWGSVWELTERGRRALSAPYVTYP